MPPLPEKKISAGSEMKANGTEYPQAYYHLQNSRVHSGNSAAQPMPLWELVALVRPRRLLWESALKALRRGAAWWLLGAGTGRRHLWALNALS